MSLASYTTDQIRQEIHRRKAATDAQKTLETLCGTWQTVGEVERRTGLARWQCAGALQRLNERDLVTWHVFGGVVMWKRIDITDN